MEEEEEEEKEEEEEEEETGRSAVPLALMTVKQNNIYFTKFHCVRFFRCVEKNKARQRPDVL